jgi:uncharacterized membrane protein
MPSSRWLSVRPSFQAFVITFILAGMYWVGHRDLFALIRRTDRGLVWLNILYLLPLCLLPFAAGMLGRYDQEPAALRIYGLVLVAIAVMRVVIWLYATNRPHLLWQRLDDRQRRAGLGLNVLPGLVYLLAILVAKVAPGLSLLIYGAVPVLYLLGITVFAAAGSETRSTRTSPNHPGRANSSLQGRAGGQAMCGSCRRLFLSWDDAYPMQTGLVCAVTVLWPNVSRPAAAVGGRPAAGGGRLREQISPVIGDAAQP